MDNVSQQQRNILRQNVRAYMESIMYNLPHVIDVGWPSMAIDGCHSLSSVLSDFCGTAQSHMNESFILMDFRMSPDEIVYYFNLWMHDGGLWYTAFVDILTPYNIQFRDKVEKILREGKSKKRRLFIIYVESKLHGGSHATHFVFDTYKKRQVFFDPDNVHNKQHLNVIDALNPVHDTYTVITTPRAKPTEISFQSAFEDVLPPDDETDGSINRGLCIILNFIVMLLELRFQLFNPVAICRAILDAYPTNAERQSFIMRAKALFMIACGPREQIVNQIRTPANFQEYNLPCGVYCTKSKTFCVRNRCPGHNFCWQHRYICASPNNVSKKCSAQDARPCTDVF